MGYSETKHYDAIIQRQIRSGRATSKTEVIHQALDLLDGIYGRVTNVDPLPSDALQRLYSERKDDEGAIRRLIAAQPKPKPE